VAIIGAGPAGLYCAWRLLQDPAFQDKRIRLFDAAGEPGGRVLTVALPQVPYVCELGAMRYLQDQILVHSLVEKLELERADFSFENAGYCLRGRFIGADKFKKPNGGIATYEVPYKVEPGEEWKSPVELIVLGIQRGLRELRIEAPGSVVTRDVLQRLQRKLDALGRNDLVNLYEEFSAQEWRLIKRYGSIRGEPLFKIGFWDLIQFNLSDEAFNLAHDGSGYQSILDMWNAADAVLWYLADFAGSSYKTIVGGMATLTRRLHSDIESMIARRGPRGEAAFTPYWELRSIEHRAGTSDGPFRLTFAIENFVHPEQGRRPAKTIRADKVILALPQPALKALAISGLKIDEKDNDDLALANFHALLDTVTANPLFKAFLIYPDTWWTPETVSSSCFRVFTDLPLRQVYHFSAKDWKCPLLPSTLDATKFSMLLLYSDSRYGDYWKCLDDISGLDERYYSEKFQKSLGAAVWHAYDPLLERHGTSDLVMKRVRTQLAKVTGREEVPPPSVAILRHWSDPPFHAGWHSWNVGFESWKVASRLVRPFLGAELFSCGEAFSSEQGWIEGALKSAERVLHGLGLPPPSWVDPQEFESHMERWT
jgi:lysine 2-monooxygenase